MRHTRGDTGGSVLPMLPQHGVVSQWSRHTLLADRGGYFSRDAPRLDPLRPPSASRRLGVPGCEGLGRPSFPLIFLHPGVLVASLLL